MICIQIGEAIAFFEYFGKVNTTFEIKTKEFIVFSCVICTIECTCGLGIKIMQNILASNKKKIIYG